MSNHRQKQWLSVKLPSLSHGPVIKLLLVAHFATKQTPDNIGDGNCEAVPATLPPVRHTSLSRASRCWRIWWHHITTVESWFFFILDAQLSVLLRPQKGPCQGIWTHRPVNKCMTRCGSRTLGKALASAEIMVISVIQHFMCFLSFWPFRLSDFQCMWFSTFFLHVECLVVGRYWCNVVADKKSLNGRWLLWKKIFPEENILHFFNRFSRQIITY